MATPSTLPRRKGWAFFYCSLTSSLTRRRTFFTLAFNWEKKNNPVEPHLLCWGSPVKRKTESSKRVKSRIQLIDILLQSSWEQKYTWINESVAGKSVAEFLLNRSCRGSLTSWPGCLHVILVSLVDARGGLFPTLFPFSAASVPSVNKCLTLDLAHILWKSNTAEVCI